MLDPMEKTGDFRPGESRSDFDFTKIAEFKDQDSLFLADKDNKDKLTKPEKINEPRKHKR